MWTVAAALLLFRSAGAFLPPISERAAPQPLTIMSMSTEAKHSDALQGVFRAFGVAAAVLTFNTVGAFATPAPFIEEPEGR